MSSDRPRLTLSDGVAEAVVLPWRGAGLERYDLISGGRPEPLFRPAPSNATAPFALANILLLPWSNRISGGGFHFGGAFHPLAPNVLGEPFPIHGNGFTSEWRVMRHSQDQVVLSLMSEGPGPFRYEAEASYALSKGALTMRLAAINRAEAPLPYGLGFHPWLPRTPATLLAASAQGVWLEDQRHLPDGRAPIGERPDWDFSSPRKLPPNWINNGFDGWGGRATIVWPERGQALDIEATPDLGAYIVYSPSADADFFCFEPVTHAVDAHNLPDGPTENGLRILTPGEGFAVACTFAPRAMR